MVKGKTKVISNSHGLTFEDRVDDFLDTIDIRQIVKMEYSTNNQGSSTIYTVLIIYISMEDVRSSKIDNILDN